MWRTTRRSLLAHKLRLAFLQQSVREMGQTIVMVTHDATAASYADRVLFLADGRIVDEMLDPTADRVLERMKAFDQKVVDLVAGTAVAEVR